MYMKRRTEQDGDKAVSPVVGVMLMLVVTIIIAAVVSGFAGGLISGNNQKTPSLTMDVKIANTGTWTGSGFSAMVTSVSDPISTGDLKITTSWKASNGVVGGNTSLAKTANARYLVPGSGSSQRAMGAPFGSGPGVQVYNPTAPKPEQQFGNYTLMEGTGLYAMPFGSTSGAAIGGYPGSSAIEGYGVTTPYVYNTTGAYYSIDAMQGVLGGGWENLRAGDTVSVRIIHVPSGKTILQKDVAVSEG